MYRKLKNKRNDCNEIYDKMQELNRRIKRNQCQMYLMNKARAGQEVKVDKNEFATSTKILSEIRKGNVLVQGIDPGIVTTASVNCTKSSTLFNSINRFQCLEDGETELVHQHDEEDLKNFRYNITARRVNQVVLSTHHRLQRERKQKLSEPIEKKSVEKKAVTRKIRLKRYYKKYISSNRDLMFQHFQTRKEKGSLITFLGNWSRVGSYIKGHTRRSLGPVMDRLKSVEKDSLYTTDEFRSTVTCNSCFSITTKQLMRVGDNRTRRIKGAVVCSNKHCPRRIKSNSTTVNRDQNGAINIALIGFSKIVSVDGQALPPFRRNYKSSKYEIGRAHV